MRCTGGAAGLSLHTREPRAGASVPPEGAARSEAGKGDSSAPPPTDACSPPDGPHPAPSLGRREGPRPSTVPYRERALKWMTAAAEWLPQEAGFLQGPREHSAPGQSPQLLGGAGRVWKRIRGSIECC